MSELHSLELTQCLLTLWVLCHISHTWLQLYECNALLKIQAKHQYSQCAYVKLKSSRNHADLLGCWKRNSCYVLFVNVAMWFTASTLASNNWLLTAQCFQRFSASELRKSLIFLFLNEIFPYFISVSGLNPVSWVNKYTDLISFHGSRCYDAESCACNNLH